MHTHTHTHGSFFNSNVCDMKKKGIFLHTYMHTLTGHICELKQDAV